MKMYSKENQCMVDITKLEKIGDDLVMRCKLMGAYSMPIYLKPEELREALTLLSWDVVSYLPMMLIRNTEAEEAILELLKNIGEYIPDYIGRAFGSEAEESSRKIAKIVAETSIDAFKILFDKIIQEL